MSLFMARNIEAGYGAAQILHGVDVSVELKEIVTIIGPNGCGKSTFLKTVMGLVPWSRGTARFGEIDLLGCRTDAVVRHGVGYVPQLNNVFPTLTVRENLEIGGYLLPRATLGARIAEIADLIPFLTKRLPQAAGTMSGGERQLLALASALMTRPALVLLDEPSAGLSPQATTKMFDTVRSLRNSLDLTILLVEQNVFQAFEISDRAYVLSMGRNEVDGLPADLVRDERVRVAYLGGEPAAVPQA
jgi:ABC-type branched-subunit amino acid transport system ATPase component